MPWWNIWFIEENKYDYGRRLNKWKVKKFKIIKKLKYLTKNIKKSQGSEKITNEIECKRIKSLHFIYNSVRIW